MIKKQQKTIRSNCSEDGHRAAQSGEASKRNGEFKMQKVQHERDQTRTHRALHQQEEPQMHRVQDRQEKTKSHKALQWHAEAQMCEIQGEERRVNSTQAHHRKARARLNVIPE